MLIENRSQLRDVNLALSGALVANFRALIYISATAFPTLTNC